MRRFYILTICILTENEIYFVKIKYILLLLVFSFEIAKRVADDSYGLIFGVNLFFALLIQTLTLVIINIFVLNIRQQVDYALTTREIAQLIIQ